MIQFKIKGKQWSIVEPTIRDYYAIQQLLVSDSVSTRIEIISKLSKCPSSDLKQLDKYQFDALWTSTLEGPLNADANATFYKHFQFNGKLYGFEDFKAMTIGEFADMDVLRQDPRNAENLHKMMAVLYRPAIAITDDWIVVDPYNSDLVEKQAVVFMDLPLKYVFGSLSFFLQIRKTSIEVMLDSLKQMNCKTTEEAELLSLTKALILDLPETGIGLSPSWLETTQQRLQALQDLASTMHSTILPTEKTKPKPKRWPLSVLRLKTN